MITIFAPHFTELITVRQDKVKINLTKINIWKKNWKFLINNSLFKIFSRHFLKRKILRLSLWIEWKYTRRWLLLLLHKKGQFYMGLLWQLECASGKEISNGVHHFRLCLCRLLPKRRWRVWVVSLCLVFLIFLSVYLIASYSFNPWIDYSLIVYIAKI